jgi:hypothetical protein
MARIALVAAVLLVACGVAFATAPTTPPATPTGPQAPAAPQGGTSINGTIAAAQSYVLTYTTVNFPSAQFCTAVQTATGATNCTVTDVQNTNNAGRKFTEQAQGVLVSYQAASSNPAAFLNSIISAANSGVLAPFVVTRSQAGIVVAPAPAPGTVVAPAFTGTLAVIDWVIVQTVTSFDINAQAAFRSAIVQALGGPQNATVTINQPITQTTVGTKMSVQTAALQVTTTINAPAFVSSAAITQRLQDTVRNNGGRIGAFTVISLSGNTFNPAALVRPTIMWAAAALLLVAMLF